MQVVIAVGNIGIGIDGVFHTMEEAQRKAEAFFQAGPSEMAIVGWDYGAGKTTCSAVFRDAAKQDYLILKTCVVGEWTGGC